ncbi:tape measure protein [Streptococcus phage SW6]|uniref:Tape measure protein n=1 Tax=Streptococcus phage SW6 TaxID=2419655 RepID=A0A3S5H0I9_9CAUD|nr:tape measure protein [Streptococcus phage SW6]AYP29047.1 tape measure protein [Streptococcus phage SW6]AYP30001.1 tape measure protein [Streptococcus phage SW30]
MAKIQATMSTEIALDTLQAADSIKRLTQLVNSSTNAWKAQESQMRSAGDYLGAAQAKYDGLSNTIQNQQQKIEKLKQEQSQLKGSTVEVAEQYLKYQQQIDQATTRLAALENQQRQAKQSLDYHKSGLAELQKEYKAQNEASDTYIKRLKAEGKEDESRQEQLKQYKGSIANLNKQYETQKEMLERIAKQTSKTSEEYLIQKKRLDETATSLAHTRNAANKLNDEIEQSQRSSTFIGHLKESFHRLGNEVDDTEQKTSRLKGVFSATFTANVISNGFQNALGAIKGKFDEIAQSSSEYVKYQQTMNATWLTLTGNAEEGKKMVDMTNQMAQAAANSTEMVDGMNQKFYAVTHNTELTKQQTQAILTLQDAFGQTDAAVENFATQWAQMIANGKVQGQDMMSIINVFPEMKQAIKDVAAEQLGIANMTTEQFAKLQSEGKITSDMAIEALLRTKDKYKDATENFAGTIGGMERTLNSRMPAIIAAFRDPIDKMKNPFLGKVSEWVADKSTEDKFKTLGEHSAKGLETISNAFAKVFNMGDGTDKLNSFMDKMIEWVDKTSNKIAQNAPKIASFFTELKKGLGYIIEIGKAFGEGVWEATKGIVEGIAGAFKTLNGNSKKSKEPIKGVSDALGEIAKHKEAIQTIGKLFVGYFASKAVLNTSKSLFGTITDGISNVKKAGSKVNGALNWVMGVRGEDAVNNKLGGIKKIGRGTKSAFKWTASVATKTAKLALTGLLNTAKFVGNGIKLAFNFSKANPLILIATAVIGISTALYELYKHNKKFKKFVDDLAKNAKKAFDNIVKWFKDIPKNLSKTWENIKDGAKSGMKNLGSAITGKLSDIGKEWKKGWKNSKDYLSDRWDDMKGNTKESIKRLGSSIKDKHDEIHDRWSKTWNKSKDFLSDRWDDMNADAKKKFGKDLKGLLFSNLDAIGSKFQDIWNGIRNGFSDMWNGLKDLAGNGINAVIKIPNDGIDGINGLIHDFGGPKNAIGKIPKVKFADGTGLFSSYRNPITRPTLATLNDGNDSPETNNQEMVILPNGKSFLPQGRNVEYLLPAGSEVINASELAMLMGVERGAYAKGTGFWSKIWDTTTNVAGSVWNGLKNGVDKFKKMIDFVRSAITDPVGTLAKTFSPNADKLGAMFTPLGNALYKKPVGEAKSWWKELWSMANASMDEGTVAIGAKGDDYRFKDKAKDAGVDPWGYYYRECVSFIASRLANLGVNPSLFSHLGNGNQWVSAKVPHLSRPKPGVVSVYTGGPVSSNHVDFVTAVHGDTYDGEDYNYNGDGKYHQFTGRHVKNAATFLDFGVRDFGSSGEDGKPLKDKNNPRQTLIKRQVGGMFDWIKKTLGPLLNPSGGGEDHQQGTGVARWRDTVVRALEANGIEPNNFRVSKILATIQRESNGDPNAQNNWDSNALAGHPSIGLMQTIGPTFNAYKHKGHDNIRNGYDNLLAAINYIKHRYGTSDAAFNRVAAYGYANGGLVQKNGVYELAEGDMPEYVIPTDIAKRGRAWQLLSEAVARFAGDAPQGNSDNTSNHKRVSVLEDKLDVMIGLLSQLVTNGSKPIEIQNIIDGRSVSNGLAPFMTKATNEYERRQALLGGQII